MLTKQDTEQLRTMERRSAGAERRRGGEGERREKIKGGLNGERETVGGGEQERDEERKGAQEARRERMGGGGRKGNSGRERYR